MPEELRRLRKDYVWDGLVMHHAGNLLIGASNGGRAAERRHVICISRRVHVASYMLQRSTAACYQPEQARVLHASLRQPAFTAPKCCLYSRHQISSFTSSDSYPSIIHRGSMSVHRLKDACRVHAPNHVCSWLASAASGLPGLLPYPLPPRVIADRKRNRDPFHPPYSAGRG